MTGNDYLTLGATRDEWDAISSTLNRAWHQSTLTEIKQQCRNEQQNNWTPVTLTVAQAWTMSADIRATLPDLADRIAACLGELRDPL